MRAPYNWTGFYVGINGGGGWGSSTWSNPAGTADADLAGGVVGGTLGYNYQMGQTVFGLEGDLDWSNIRGSTSTGLCAGISLRNPQLLGSPRARPHRLRLRPRHALRHRRRGLRRHQGDAGRPRHARPPPRSAGRSAAASKSPSPARGPPRSNISMPISARAAAAPRSAASRPTSSFTTNIVRAGINYRF